MRVLACVTIVERLSHSRAPSHSLMLRLLVVAATGGLGAAVVREALAHNHSVSVLVRSADKLRDTFGDDASRLTAVHVGSATDDALIAAAVKGVSAVISCAPPDPTIASALAKATKNEGVRLVWTAGAYTSVSASLEVHIRSDVALRSGASNIFETDGVTLHYKAFGASGEGYYKAHTPCIDAVKATGTSYLIWCPGLMKNGARSVPAPKTLTRADPAGLAQWDFVSYRASHPVCVYLFCAALKMRADGRDGCVC